MAGPLYTTKEFWMTNTTAACLHCGGPILHRPIPVVTEGMQCGEGIRAIGLACSWPCNRACIDDFGTNDDIERVNTAIMAEFRSSLSEGDDPDGFTFLQPFSRFSEIHRAPHRKEFALYGGSITFERWREMWSRTAPRPTATFASSMNERKWNEGGIPSAAQVTDESDILGLQASFPERSSHDFQRRTTGFSLRRPIGVKRLAPPTTFITIPDLTARIP